MKTAPECPTYYKKAPGRGRSYQDFIGKYSVFVRLQFIKMMYNKDESTIDPPLQRGRLLGFKVNLPRAANLRGEVYFLLRSDMINAMSIPKAMTRDSTRYSSSSIASPPFQRGEPSSHEKPIYCAPLIITQNSPLFGKVLHFFKSLGHHKKPPVVFRRFLYYRGPPFSISAEAWVNFLKLSLNFCASSFALAS